MSQWLYDERKGYYTNYKAIGKAGDFYTSVSTSKFFGGAIAKEIIALIQGGSLSRSATICEIGAHHGYLLADIIEFIHTLEPALIATLNFAIIERFETLQVYQVNYFKEAFGDSIALQHYRAVNECAFDDVFYISNEIFDAFPCELFYKGKIAEVHHHTVEFSAQDEDIQARAHKQKRDKGEFSVGYETFAEEIVRSANRVHFMSFDYGEMQPRLDFSLRIYHNHSVHPFFEEGLDYMSLFQNSDITYDVDFSHVKRAFEATGAKMVAYKSQMRALIEMGIMELMQILQRHNTQEVYEQEMQKVKKLILPEFLGERFKMIYFTTT